MVPYPPSAADPQTSAAAGASGPQGPDPPWSVPGPLSSAAAIALATVIWKKMWAPFFQSTLERGLQRWNRSVEPVGGTGV